MLYKVWKAENSFGNELICMRPVRLPAAYNNSCKMLQIGFINPF